MRLGGNKPKTVAPNLADVLADEWHDADEGVESAWGNDDLIDVNADTDDWAAFESAPVSEIVAPPPQSYYVNPPSQSSANGTAKTAAPKAAKPTPAPARQAPSLAPVVSPVPSKSSPMPAPTPVMSSNDGWGDIDDEKPASASPALEASSTPSLAGMSKEEKDKEMARRREERKAVSLFFEIRMSLSVQRIAAMKEQKKGKA